MDGSVAENQNLAVNRVSSRMLPPVETSNNDQVVHRMRELGLWDLISQLAQPGGGSEGQLPGVDMTAAEQLKVELFRLAQSNLPVASATGQSRKTENEVRMPELNEEELTREILKLGPWHMNVQLTETLSTGQAFDNTGSIRNRDKNKGISLLSLREHFVKKLNAIYPQGITNKSFLDCACNSGGYCFWARELEIKQALGFDVREHWIRQAKFIQAYRQVAPTDRIEFQVCDLYDLPKLGRAPADITMFKGIFYHLPDPITGLKMAADMTKEVMFFNTSTTWGEADGYLKCGWESRERLMSGVHGLKWYATGPKVLSDILKWCGFAEQRLMFFVQQHDQPQLGRVEIIASKVPGLLEHVGGESA